MMVGCEDQRGRILHLREIMQAVDPVHLGAGQTFDRDTNRSVDQTFAHKLGR